MTERRLYDFGRFRLDGGERVLSRDGQPVALPPKDLDTLLVLVENRGHIVEKEELLRRVWPDAFVEEGNLARRISNLRSVLGEDADGRQFIDTVPKRGYRFVAEVVERNGQLALEGTAERSAVAEPAAGEARASKKRRALWGVVAGGLAGVVFSAVVGFCGLAGGPPPAPHRRIGAGLALR